MTESIYKTYSDDQLQDLFSQFLISSWSYSKVTSFARNEKAFEMTYIYGMYGKKSATSVAGNAYHEALEAYFKGIAAGEPVDIVYCEHVAFEYINEVPANQWKIQKTTPYVEDCQKKAYETATKLIHNFFTESDVYLDNLEEVLGVEVYCSEFLLVNGVDVPLPCHLKIDLIIRTKDGKVVIIDHKSKTSFSDEDEVALSAGCQAITYVKGFEAKTGIIVDEVWFIENKHSKNKDGSPQLNCFEIKIDSDTRILYEALLYEPLKRMIEAVSDPDYVYLINDSDNFVDKAELYDFWAKTQISEVEDFNVEDTKKELVSRRLKKIRDASIGSISPTVIRNFKENASKFIQYDLSNKNMTHSEKVEHALRAQGIVVQVAHQFTGYSSNTLLLEASAGVKISSIFSRRLDMANALDVANVRVGRELKVHAGKSYVQVDFETKRNGDLFFDAALLVDRKIPIGKDNFGELVVWDLDNHNTPHALICGSTGSGKSVCVKSIIEFSLLANMEKIVILDPKHEFKSYHNGSTVFVYNEIIEIEEAMKSLVDEMNELVRSGRKSKTLIVFDEFADAYDNARRGKDLDVKEMVQVGEYAPKKHPMGFYMEPEPKMALRTTSVLKSLEENLKMLLQKSRSVGFNILPATQRASTKIISGDLKANLPVQICFNVPKQVDSIVVLDEPGAESLAGRGDGLIKSPEYKDTIRFQAFYKP